MHRLTLFVRRIVLSGSKSKRLPSHHSARIVREKITAKLLDRSPGQIKQGLTDCPVE
ncbi:hypothetical protein RESH_02227 [Rhodopirellula europaea SH398]|uniref:Uncharacterized protein n=2 Tax=Rhodopirellula europaea TaxID=1263866 RepID=M5S6U5_9BACT|nr:hypothetical protein RE6C_06047 [Rhodopirellula europaea 6C]EMI27220.1 hypothetical protein RESH_02227 [Rhodopirellula europaea SH398]